VEFFFLDLDQGRRPNDQNPQMMAAPWGLVLVEDWCLLKPRPPSPRGHGSYTLCTEAAALMQINGLCRGLRYSRAW
jgi:hypothetical protein